MFYHLLSKYCVLVIWTALVPSELSLSANQYLLTSRVIPDTLTNETINILLAKVQAIKPSINTKEKFLWM